MTTPKFVKVELLVKASQKNNLSNIKLTFNDCGLMITGDYIIVVVDERDEINGSLTSTGKIFQLKDIEAYKTHAQ